VHLNPEGTLHLDRATIAALGYDPDEHEDMFDFKRAGLRRDKTFLYLENGNRHKITHVEALHYDRATNTCDLSIQDAMKLALARVAHRPLSRSCHGLLDRRRLDTMNADILHTPITPESHVRLRSPRPMET
jgi:hypothetical protein